MAATAPEPERIEFPEAAVPQHARYPLVDTVRAFAALSIFFFHGFTKLGLVTNDAVSHYLGNLNVGVPVFFVVSGFLLYRPFVVASLRGARPPRSGSYATRRVMRIVPAYWVALTIIAIVLGETYVFTPSGIITYYGFLQIYSETTVTNGIGQAWTLCVEVTFYIAVPLCALFARRFLDRAGDRAATVRNELIALGVVYLLSVLWKYGVTELLVPGDTGYIPGQITLPAQMDTFALGMALGVIAAAIADGARPPGFVRLVERAPWVPLLLAAGLFAIAGLRIWGFGDNWADHELIRHQIKAWIGALVLMPAVFGVAGGGLVRRFMDLRGLLWIGVISYSFYLWHLAIIMELKKISGFMDLGEGYVMATALLVTIAIAWASYRLIEAPAMALGRRWSTRGSSRVSGR